MSTYSKSSKPLIGTRILIGRAKHQAGSLSAELRKLGAEVIEIPFIEIRKPRSFRPLDSALKRLSSYDWLILTSVNGVEAMWARLEKLLRRNQKSDYKGAGAGPSLALELPWKSGASAPRSRPKKEECLAAEAHLRIAAIGPATKKALEERGLPVDVVPDQYVAESVVSSLKSEVKGKRVLLIRAKVARDVIPRDLRKAGAQVDVVEAYETVIPKSSRGELQAVLHDPRKRPHLVTFTSSSTVKNFIQLLGRNRANLEGILTASIGPVTSATLRENKLAVDIAAREFTIPGLIAAIVEVREKCDPPQAI